MAIKALDQRSAISKSDVRVDGGLSGKLRAKTPGLEAQRCSGLQEKGGVVDARYPQRRIPAKLQAPSSKLKR